jgi:hypothetical protein
VELVSESRRAARRGARSRWLGRLGRAGLAAQGICFGIIGVLAIELALGKGGEATDPEGALNALARGGWTRVLLVLLSVGFAGYALWRFAQAIFDRGGMGSDVGGLFRRSIQFVQGVTYALLTVAAVGTVVGARARSGGERRAAAGVLGWPGGREIVALAGAILLIAAVVIAYWALSRRFRESLAIEQMDARTERLVTAFGIVGLSALGLVLGIVGWFLVRAALDFDPQAPVGIGGALSKLANATYGHALLGLTAAGFIVFAIFDLFQARYHRA